MLLMYPAHALTPGKANSIQLKTSSGGSVAYVCDTETEMVEWISALDGSIQKIVKTLAGGWAGRAGGRAACKGGSRPVCARGSGRVLFVWVLRIAVMEWSRVVLG